MRVDDAYLLDMLLAARKAKAFTEGQTRETFMASELHQSAVIRELQVIGEAARLVSDESKTKYDNIPWHEIAGMRNRLIHEYFRVNLEIVWKVISEELDPLISELIQIIPNED